MSEEEGPTAAVETGFQTFGNVSESSGTYTLTEASHSGIFKETDAAHRRAGSALRGVVFPRQEMATTSKFILAASMRSTACET